MSDLKVLVVDDVDFFRDIMARYLRRTPAELLFAASGEEALEVVRRERPNLVYMDVGLPGMSGINCCQEMKGDPNLGEIPVVMIFTPGRDADQAEVVASGCDGYLLKPFGREDFLNLGHKFLFPVERREPRVSCQMTVDFTLAGKVFRGRGYDLSRSGMYIECRDELPPENQVRLQFLLPTISSTMVRAHGRITWVNQGFPRKNLKLPQGFGLSFTLIGKESNEIVLEFLKEHGGLVDDVEPFEEFPDVE
ncbi:MAG: hypothetical protein C0616_13340 [Desulfuromonas sp.]|nr:MAG: hypothetical protein C0616_13340 [Desulfuromonas sp.]